MNKDTATVVPWDETAHKAGLRYSLSGEQLYFVNEPRSYFDGDTCDENAHFFVLLCDGEPVGFAVVDGGPPRLAYTDNPHSLLIRGVSINPEYQGQGLGTVFMAKLPDAVVQYLPDSGATELVLGVNVANRGAFHVYTNSGYELCERQVVGDHGPQHVMRMPLG